MGDFGEMFSLGIGPAVAYDSDAGDKGLLGITAGFSILSAKEEFISGGKEIHITCHYKYFFNDVREGVYVAPMLGWALVGYSYDVAPPVISSSGDEALGGVSFGICDGYVVNERIDIGLRYQMIRATADADATMTAGEPSTGLGFIGLRAMYNFRPHGSWHMQKAAPNRAAFCVRAVQCSIISTTMRHGVR